MIYRIDEAIKKATELESHAWDGMSLEEVQMAKETDWKPRVIGLVREIKLLREDYQPVHSMPDANWLTDEQRLFIKQHPEGKVVWNMGFGIEVEMETGGVIVAKSQRALLSRTSTLKGYVWGWIERTGKWSEDLDKWEIDNFVPKEAECSVSKEERWKWCCQKFRECEIIKLYNELVIKAEKWGGVTVRGERPQKGWKGKPTRAYFRSQAGLEDAGWGKDQWDKQEAYMYPVVTEEELKDRDFKFMLEEQTFKYIKAMCREHFWSSYSKKQQWQWELDYYRFWRRGSISETRVDREVASVVIALEHWRYIARQELRATKIVGKEVKFREMGKTSKRTEDMISYTWRKLPEGLQKVIG